MAFIDHYTHLYQIVRHQLSYMQLYKRAQGPNAQCMDYHDLSSALQLVTIYYHVLKQTIWLQLTLDFVLS